MNAVEVQTVRVVLGGAEVLHGVDLSAAPGEWLTIIGPNGAGKSTLLRALGGLIPFHGSIALHGTPLKQLPRRERARMVATVPQAPQVPAGMAVLDYVLLGRTPYIRALGSESTSDIEVTREVLDRLDLAVLAERPLSTLSGGERQRAFLARALAQLHLPAHAAARGPERRGILLLDEPTSSLDIGHQQEVLDLVDELRAGGGLTVVSTMHDLSIAGGYADRLVLLARGRIAAEGKPTEVLTEETLAEHYGARVMVVPGEHGPLVVPVRTAPRRR